MTTGDIRSSAVRKKLNRLYWESDRSVNQIAEDLGVSKGTLYDVVESRSSGVRCPACDGETVYPNRTARDRGEATCTACGLETEVTGAGSVAVGSPGSRAGARLAELKDRLPRPDWSMGEGREALTRLVAGTALLGVAAGILMAKVFRKS